MVIISGVQIFRMFTVCLNAETIMIIVAMFIFAVLTLINSSVSSIHTKFVQEVSVSLIINSSLPKSFVGIRIQRTI